MSRSKSRSPVRAVDVSACTRPSLYPEPFASRMAGRSRQRLGDHFGLQNFGVNLTRLAPGAMTALRHAHRVQDEFVYVLEGYPTLHDNDGATCLSPGMCIGCRAGSDNAANFVNETDREVVLLEIGDRMPGDEVSYPDDDLLARSIDGSWRFFHKDGSSYD